MAVTVNEMLVRLLTNIVLLIFSLVGGYIVAWLKKNLTAQQLATAADIATIAVRAAEQIGYTQGFDGREKLQKALDTAKELARQYGIVFTDDQWNALLEQAVQQLKALDEELHTKGN